METKLNIKEFRIGNLVDRGDYICRVVGIFEKDNGLVLDAINYKGERFVVQEVKPITLTEEWLLKFGFIDGEKNRIKLIRINQYYYICYVNGSRSLSVDIKYVHQLQNLYFALTGEELKIEL